MPDSIRKSIAKLEEKLRRDSKPVNIPFAEFMVQTQKNPPRTLRNIFQLFHDMIHYYVKEGYNEYPNDPESINYIHYDTGKLFVEDSDNPFFADRLLANRLVTLADSLRSGAVRNKMLVFVGPPGSGKSTFLTNLLRQMENYGQTEDGAMFETVWQIDVEKFGFPYIPNVIDWEAIGFKGGIEPVREGEGTAAGHDKYLVVPCPSHDHPLIQIPRELRRDLLNEIVTDSDFKKILFHRKEYEWLFTDSPCPVCSSLYRALENRISPEEILSMLYVRKYEFSRKLGEGVSVYNPGDKVMKDPLGNTELQKWLDTLFRSSNEVRYTYSRMAKTNNGIFAVMDIKSNNIERIINIHGIISDGIHKVECYEEHINSLFMALVNPEDMDVINDEKSFTDRVIKIPIPYIRDYTTEAAIYHNAYGGILDRYFLPHVLTSFAKVIVASRLMWDSGAVREWIEDAEIYGKFCDRDLLLLKMEIYSGNIPFWLTEKDVKRLDRTRRRNIILQGNDEGRSGVSGRDSLEVFNGFFSRFRGRQYLIGIRDVVAFCATEPKVKDKIPEGFLDSLVNMYEYIILQEIKESMFYYNQDQIRNDILDYFFAVSNDIGNEVECPFTHHRFAVSDDYFETIEKRLLGEATTMEERDKFRNDTLRRYVARTIHEGTADKLIDTVHFQELLRMYNHNLKENVLDPFITNDNFRRAIKDFGTAAFNKYDRRIIEEVQFLMKNLKFKFNYTELGAKQICIYAIDHQLADKFGNIGSRGDTAI